MKLLKDFKSTELTERVKDIETSDFKLSPSGRKIRAKRFKVGERIKRDDLENNNDDSMIDVDGKKMKESVNESKDLSTDPPVMLLLKRKSIRLYPNKTKVALYYNSKIDKYFTLTYGPEIETSNLQAESFEPIEESVMDSLHKIVKGKQSATVKFANGQTRKVDHFTASAITQVHSALNDENKKKISDMVHKSPEHLAKVADFAFSKRK
jgi:hypothetical protein